MISLPPALGHLSLAMLGSLLVAVCCLAVAPPPSTVPEFIKDAEGLDEALRNLKASMVATPVLSPQEARSRFTSAIGSVDLIAAEPVVKQPLFLTFDERGRLWVTQYRQYPFPAGLKVVAYDRYIRAKFDKIPPPPPDHFKGVDRITIHEDTNKDGSFTKVTTFLDDLNIATAALPGDGGVWVLNPPYLLFYPTKDDKPGKPVVHLSGFGLEDTHAVASSLCWGPDGWLYGAQGSTCTAKIRVEITREKSTTDFLGQAIWRYHPSEHRFEIFAEGGGNTFGVVFDSAGRIYSGTNWGQYRGLHYVQGGYYIKGWGKHGPLTNPYALGYFNHMPHQGNADRLVHTFIVYDDTAIPTLKSKIVGVNSLQKRVQVTELIPDRSSFKTKEEPFLLTTPDGRFRPVDVKVGPEGALYIADLYEPRINHVDPRDNWDKATGRLWRITPEGSRRAVSDLTLLSSKQLVAKLSSPIRWERDCALRLLSWRKDRSVLGDLHSLLFGPVNERVPESAMLALCAIQQIAGLQEKLALRALQHPNAHVRRWAVRLLGDDSRTSPLLSDAMTQLSQKEKDAEVRSQLASSAKRFPAETALQILSALWLREAEDAHDPHIGLLTWWALERHSESAREASVSLLREPKIRSAPLVQAFILERIMQRWAMAGGEANLAACAALLSASKGQANPLLAGLEKGFAGRSAKPSAALHKAILMAWDAGNTEAKLSLGLRLAHEPAITEALALIGDEKSNVNQRTQILRILGEIEIPKAIDVLLRVVATSKSAMIRQEAMQSLMRYADVRIAESILALPLEKLSEAERSTALTLVSGRASWAKELLLKIDAGKISPRLIPIEIVQKLALHKDEALEKLMTKHFGRVRASNTQEKQREMLRIGKILQSSKGDLERGKVVYKNQCGKCHKLFGEGGEVGPDLTGYERSNRLYWLENIIDPSAVIREEYVSFIVQTEDGRTLTGLVAGQDKTTVTLKDQEGRLSKIDRSKIEQMRASPISIMPEGQLKPLSDQEIRDLFAWLMK